MWRRIFDRPTWQGMVLITLVVFALLHTIDNAYPSSHALCPFGGLASLYSLITAGAFVHRVHSSALFILLAVLLISVVAGRAFCSWLCPLGTIGEWVHKAARKLGVKKTVPVPRVLDGRLRYLKYIVLVVILYLAWTAGELIYRGWCPWSAFMTIFEPDELIEDVLMGGIILLAVVGISAVNERFFCKYLCPLGAALSIFNRFSILKPRREATCSSCAICETRCPSGVAITQGTVINDAECIRCFRCLDTCPDRGSLAFNIRGLSPRIAGILIVCIFGATILFSIQAGYWEKGRVFFRESGAVSAPAVTPELDEIKASTRLGDVAQITGLALETVCQLCGAPDGLSADSTIRDLSEMTGYTRRQILVILSEEAAGP